MSPPRFVTDEDVFSAVAVGLRQHGFDAVSTPEAGRLSEDDRSQLQWAADSGRALVAALSADDLRDRLEFLTSWPT